MPIKKLSAFCLLWLLLLSTSISYAEDTLDINAELSHPGIKLVVVEFYATWCKPCMEAVPKWKALHEKYKKHGLRFIVVSTDEGVCSKPPEWSPDKSLCDSDENIQRKFAQMVGQKNLSLPSSFLFSWEGKLSMMSHTVEPVDNAIRSYFTDTNYKVKVQPVEVFGGKLAIGSNEEWVRDEVISNFRQKSKFDVVSESHLSSTENQTGLCDISFPANSALHIKLQGFEKGERMLSLELEKDGCIKGKATHPYKGMGFDEDKESLIYAISEAVDDLLLQLIKVRPPELIGYSVSDDNWFSRTESVVVRFNPKPDGATVIVDNKVICETTPCSESIPKGTRAVVIAKKDYIAREGRVAFNSDMTIDWELTPDFGWLSVTTEKSGIGAEIEIDGKAVGKTPLKRLKLKPGVHKVAVADHCYYLHEQTVHIKQNKSENMAFDIRPILGGLSIDSRDTEGNAIRAEVYIDDQLAGFAPDQFKVSVCAERLEVQAGGYDSYQEALSIVEKKVVNISAILTKQTNISSDKPEVFEKSPSATPEVSAGMSPARKAGWAMFFSGAAIAGVGGIMHLLANKESDKNGTTADGNKSLFDAYKYTAITGYAVGGTLATLGAVFILYVSDNKKVAQAIPIISTDGEMAMASWQTRW